MLEVTIVKKFLMEEGVFLSINEEILEKLKEASKKGLERDPEMLNGKTIKFSENCGLGVNFKKDFEEFFEFKKNPDNSTVKVLIKEVSSDQFRITVSDNVERNIGILDEWMKESIREHFNSDTLVAFDYDEDIGFISWFITL